MRGVEVVFAKVVMLSLAFKDPKIVICKNEKDLARFERTLHWLSLSRKNESTMEESSNAP